MITRIIPCIITGIITGIVPDDASRGRAARLLPTAGA
jgi:hypothetical protein